MSTVGVSIPVPQPYRDQLRAARQAAGDPLADRVPPHITLMPPTEVPSAQLADFEGHLQRVAADFGPFEMLLRGTGTFLPVSPVVFVTVAVGIPLCERLETAVRSGPVGRDLEFNYHPHVTVAHNVPRAALRRTFQELQNFNARFRVDSFELSAQHEDETWSPLAQYQLTGPTLD